MFTLTQKNINRIKIYMAIIEDRLIEDISDADVFDYIDIKEDVDQLRSIATHGSDNPLEWDWIEPRTKAEIAGDLVAASYGENDYMPFI